MYVNAVVSIRRSVLPPVDAKVDRAEGIILVSKLWVSVIFLLVLFFLCRERRRDVDVWACRGFLFRESVDNGCKKQKNKKVINVGDGIKLRDIKRH